MATKKQARSVGRGETPVFQFEQVHKALASSLKKSEENLSQLRHVASQIQLEIADLKSMLLFRELLSLLKGMTSVDLDRHHHQFHLIVRKMTEMMFARGQSFEDTLLNVKTQAVLFSGPKKNKVKMRLGEKSIRRISEEKGLRILFITGMFPSDKHGGGLRVRDILFQLCARHEVDLYSVFRSDLDKASYEAVCKSTQASRLCEGRETFCSEDVLGWLKRRNIGHGHYDIIQFEYPDSVALMKVLKPFGKKIGYTFMESVTRHHLQNFERFFRKDVAAAARSSLSLIDALQLEEKAQRLADFSIAVTEADALFTKKIFGGNPQVVPTGLNENFFKYSPLRSIQKFPNPRQRMGVIFIGYFDHSPNIDGVEWYLRHVHPELCRRHPQYHFYVVGAGAREWVDKLRHQHLKDQQLSVIGFMEEFRPLLAACRVSVAPLISGAGIRGKINQYSALSVPTVATELAACGTEYEHGKSILISKNSREFALQVSSLLNDNEVREGVAMNAMAMVKKKYLWGTLVREIESIYANA